MTDILGPLQNRLLGALSEDARKRIFPKLKLIEMSLGDVIYESDQSIEYVYFPVDCIISLLYEMINGSSAEISVVGKEGLAGVTVIMGGESTPNRFVVQSRGHAYRMPAADLKHEFNQHSEIRIITLRFTQALITQMSQTAVCNRHHTIDQQLCRWLLLSLDRLEGNKLNMTQELIANMLGVRREGVTEAAGELQKLGVIEYRRGRIVVLDRPKLESLSCECYDVVRRETLRLESRIFTEGL
jgi:CRP-like cAMP-binding protein